MNQSTMSMHTTLQSIIRLLIMSQRTTQLLITSLNTCQSLHTFQVIMSPRCTISLLRITKSLHRM